MKTGLLAIKAYTKDSISFAKINYGRKKVI
jgi:hypothetical protein